MGVTIPDKILEKTGMTAEELKQELAVLIIRPEDETIFPVCW